MVLYIHGIGEHPPRDELKQEWDLALFGKPMGVETSMAYWSDILHGRPSRIRFRSIHQEAGQHDLEIDPGEILDEEFLKPLNITQKQLADHLGCDVKVINRDAACRSSISKRVISL